MSEGLKQRVLTAILFGIPFIALLWINDLTRLILISLILIFSAGEYLNLQFGKWYKKLPALISFAGSIMLLAACIWRPEIHNYILIVGIIVNGLLIIDLFFRSVPLHRRLPGLTSIMYTSIPYALLVTMVENDFFRYFILSLIVLIWVSDSSAYFVGKSVGKNKLMPNVSPGKTLEGFLGAGLITLIFSYVLHSLVDSYSLQKWLLIGLAVWLFGSVGDLVESKFKRSINIKDSGSLLPGHGGLLDRFDGFFFSLPFVVFIVENYNI